MGDEKLKIIASRCRSLRTLAVDRCDGDDGGYDDDIDETDGDGLTAAGLHGILRECRYVRRTLSTIVMLATTPLFTGVVLLASDN